MPVQQDTARYATSQKLVSCLTNSQNLLQTDTTLSYVAPTAEVQDQQVTANAKLKPWVDAVKAAKGRTSDDLGTKYPKISEQLWKAVQSALSGSASPKDALGSAQSAVK
jgi:multiple sugar transport system substrate-binding protein